MDRERHRLRAQDKDRYYYQRNALGITRRSCRGNLLKVQRAGQPTNRSTKERDQYAWQRPLRRRRHAWTLSHSTKAQSMSFLTAFGIRFSGTMPGWADSSLPSE